MRYLYPQNLQAKPKLWLWSIKHFVILAVAAFVSAILFMKTETTVPLAITLCYGFLTIELETTSVLDFLRHALRYFFTTQIYRWQ